MSEIEKMYKNAKIKKQYCGWLDMGDLDCQMQYVTCNSINEWKEAVFSSRFGESEEEPELKYPAFTVEKQLELIKWLSIEYSFVSNYVKKYDEYILQVDDFYSTKKDFSNALAGLINTLWQDLSEQERTEIAEILK